MLLLLVVLLVVLLLVLLLLLLLCCCVASLVRVSRPDNDSVAFIYLPSVNHLTSLATSQYGALNPRALLREHMNALTHFVRVL